MPLLSVVVPVYNVEKYLRQCLDSLVNQTLENIEIIIVNDCSPDNSETTILEYALSDSRIIYIKHEENLSLGAARNTGIKAARGKYITFVDSDDYVDLNLYETAMVIFETYNIDMLTYPLHQFYNDKEEVEVFYRCYDPPFKMKTEESSLDFSFLSPCIKIYHLKDLIDHQIEFPVGLHWEDVPFWVEYSSVVEPVVFSLPKDGPAYWYRKHEHSISGKSNKNYSTYPKIFSHVVSILHRRGKLDDLVSCLCHVLSYQTSCALCILERPYLPEFVENFNEFSNKFVLLVGESLLPKAWVLMRYIESTEGKILLIERYVEFFLQKENMNNSKWYRFGKMTTKEKFQTIVRGIYRGFLKFLGLFFCINR